MTCSYRPTVTVCKHLGCVSQTVQFRFLALILFSSNKLNQTNKISDRGNDIAPNFCTYARRNIYMKSADGIFLAVPQQVVHK